MMRTALALALMTSTALAQGPDPTGALNYKAAGTSASRSLAARAADVFNIRDNGAICDGTSATLASRYANLTEAKLDYPAATSMTDTIDYQAIQRTIDLAAVTATANSVRTVFLPPSLPCLLSKNLLIPTGIVLWAWPGTAMLKPAVGNVSSVLLMVVNNNAANTGYYGIVFDGGGTAFANSAPVTQAFRNIGITFDNVRFQNTRGMAINGSNLSRAAFIHSSFVNIGNYWKTSIIVGDRKQAISVCCGDLVTWGFNIEVSDNYFEDIGLDHISISNADGVVIANNRHKGPPTGPLPVPTWPDRPAPVFFINVYNSVIIGNEINGSLGHCMDLAGPVNVAITGNLMKNCGRPGIGIADSRGYGAEVPADGATIVGNLIDGTNTDSDGIHRGAINLYGDVANVSIGSNTIKNAGEYAFWGQTSGLSPVGVQTKITIDPNNVVNNATLGTFGGTLTAFTAFAAPTSCTNQPSGALWNNGGSAAVCP